MQVSGAEKMRSAWRRYEGGAARSTCRFVVVFPPSVPLSLMDPPFVILDGLNSASNVGQVLRTAYHLGVNSVVASPATWGCLNGRACRVSMGWMYRMKFHAARPLSKAMRELQDLGVFIYAAENQFSQPVAPHEPLGDKSWALVVGSEGLGVSDEIVRMCDRRISVPQQQGHSLNVAHACSICLYELSKSSWPAQGMRCKMILICTGFGSCSLHLSPVSRSAFGRTFVQKVAPALVQRLFAGTPTSLC